MKRTSPCFALFRFLLGLGGLFGSLVFPVVAAPKIEPVPGQSTYVVDYPKATDFSGLTWIGGNGYYAVSNRTKALFPLAIDLDDTTGKILDVRFGPKIPVKTEASDFEGIAWIPEKERLYLSSESLNGIVGFDREGDARFFVEVPRIFQRARRNKSLESLTYGAGAFWTANEDALTVDGPASSSEQGALIRLQKFDADFRPIAQFAYRTDPSLVRSSQGGTGVTDLCALPTGELLVLERVVALGLVARIYLVHFEGATDTSSLPGLADREVQVTRKELLFEQHTLTSNYEGIALGPVLQDGTRSLILIADSGGETKHGLIPLRIRLDPRAAPKR